MNKKIILKESQYNRIVSLLCEDLNVNNILNSIKQNSVLNIIDFNNNENKIIVDKVEDDIVFGKDENGLEFVINMGGFNANTKELKLKKKNPNTNNFDQLTMKVVGFSVEEVDNDDESDDEFDTQKFNAYYKEVLNDPDLQKAFYTAPSLWNYFVSALKNKKATGKGIYPAYQLINKYFNDKINSKLPGFTDKENKRCSFYLIDDITIPYYQINDPKTLKHFTLYKGIHKATVRQYEPGFGDVKIVTYTASGGNYGFKIVIKKQTDDKPDEYFCDIYVNNRNVEENKYKILNVRIKFLNSDGYQTQSNIK
jgi:hypothetical protein